MDRRTWTLVFIGGCLGLVGGVAALLIDALQGDAFNAAAFGALAAGSILAVVALTQRKKV